MIRIGHAFGHAQATLPWAQLTGTLALLVDGALVKNWIEQAAQGTYRGWRVLYHFADLDDRFDEVSPVLINVRPEDRLFRHWQQDPVWRQATLLIHYHCRFEELTEHLCSLLWMRQGKEQLLMRFYSPAILDAWAPSLTDREADALLGPAECWAWLSDSDSGSESTSEDDPHTTAQVTRERASWLAHKPGQAGQGTAWFSLSDAQIAALDQHDQAQMPAPADDAAAARTQYIDYWLGYDVPAPDGLLTDE
ncbi:hypothetical protein C4K68_14950 [Pokkaliibacter plantistimulans]|uniref:DUF4123 domain-containing protein n=1 Tax=Proteobacteria bacterium 228 TaxID=2083153 RepID=A0A2S5KQI9_9PROT|nr:DUF4123 domain-containing protein [Pokkaliibacter plantistimulans]PPC76536.1 hypothetical protein C4K68_14950 [Pokkaliibacter plantistimulans]